MALTDLTPTAFIHTTDATQATAFYVGVLGLELVDESPFAVVVRSGATTIRITPVETHDPSMATVLGWEVADVESALAELVANGVEPLRFDGMEQTETGVWTAPGGARIAWFHDPDHNTLSLAQT